MNVLENYSLNKLNSFKGGASAKQFISLKTEEEVIEFSKIFDHRTTRLQILGGGTNTLFVHDFDGLVVHMQLKGIQIFGLDKTNVVIRAAAGENWDDLVVYSIEKATLNVFRFFSLCKFEKKSFFIDVRATGVWKTYPSSLAQLVEPQPKILAPLVWS